MSPTSYCGRFAPSPTGPLHFGSLVAALGSCLRARALGGRWCLRIDDLDTPRNVPGAADSILRTLEACGFTWDGEVEWQSGNLARYRSAFEALRTRGLVYPCACSRREIADSSLTPDGARRYPGTCRDGLAPGRAGRAWRLRVDDCQVRFDDALQGCMEEDVAATVGDFVLLRADDVFAYQLATVVDDGAMGVTEVVRGADLLDSTGRQICLQRALGLVTPAYCHLPAAVNGRGEKLSKQTRAQAVDAMRPQAVLAAALDFLGQRPPAGIAEAALDELWRWALEHWDLARVPRGMTRLAPAPFD